MVALRWTDDGEWCEHVEERDGGLLFFWTRDESRRRLFDAAQAKRIRRQHQMAFAIEIVEV